MRWRVRIGETRDFGRVPVFGQSGSAAKVQELASLAIRADYGEARSFSLRQYLGSTAGGMNFPIGQGLGVAVVVENATGAPIARACDPAPSSACVMIREVALSFSARPRHENTID